MRVELEEERKKRKHIEDVWHDAQREYRAPLVVPAMLDAFEKLARIAGDAIVASTPPAPVAVKAPAHASTYAYTPTAKRLRYSEYDPGWNINGTEERWDREY